MPHALPWVRSTRARPAHGDTGARGSSCALGLALGLGLLALACSKSPPESPPAAPPSAASSAGTTTPSESTAEATAAQAAPTDGTPRATNAPGDPLGPRVAPLPYPTGPVPSTLPVASAAGPAPTPNGIDEAPVVAMADPDPSAAARPTDTPAAEAALDAVGRAGVTLGDRHHLVASIFGARLCLTATSSDGVAFSACEFESEEAAAHGKEKALAMLAGSKGRAAAVNKKTLLVARPPAKATPTTSATTKKALRAFSAL